MALYPNAEQRLWYPYAPERYISATTVILHTNAVNAEDPGSTGGLSWHFQVGEHGTVYQHRDTATRAAANYNANGFAISIETWDGGNPEGNPWNPEQLDALDALIGWCCDTHGIPRTQVTAWDSPGVGYHRMFPEWNNPYHSCPGDTRASQFPDILARLQGDDMPLDTPDKQFIENTLAAVEARLSQRITDSEARQDAALPPLIGATVAATVQATAAGTVDPDAIATAVIAAIADKLK